MLIVVLNVGVRTVDFERIVIDRQVPLGVTGKVVRRRSVNLMLGIFHFTGP